MNFTKLLTNKPNSSDKRIDSILPTVIIFIGFAMASWTRYKQALHDIIADTFVIKS